MQRCSLSQKPLEHWWRRSIQPSSAPTLPLNTGLDALASNCKDRHSRSSMSVQSGSRISSSGQAITALMNFLLRKKKYDLPIPKTLLMSGHCPAPNHRKDIPTTSSGRTRPEISQWLQQNDWCYQLVEGIKWHSKGHSQLILMNKLSHVVSSYQSRSHPPLSRTVIATPYHQERKQELPLDLLHFNDVRLIIWHIGTYSGVIRNIIAWGSFWRDLDDMLTGVLYEVVDTKIVTRSRVKIHENDKVQKYSRTNCDWFVWWANAWNTFWVSNTQEQKRNDASLKGARLGRCNFWRERAGQCVGWENDRFHEGCNENDCCNFRVSFDYPLTVAVGRILFTCVVCIVVRNK